MASLINSNVNLASSTGTQKLVVDTPNAELKVNTLKNKLGNDEGITKKLTAVQRMGYKTLTRDEAKMLTPVENTDRMKKGTGITPGNTKNAGNEWSTLDDNSTAHYYYRGDPDNETGPVNVDAIQKRLRRCFDLEGLYIDKHNELMDLFGFTLNLFDKYNYSVRIVLYLLKHMVYQDLGVKSDVSMIGSDDAPSSSSDADIGSIKLPRSLITNIKALLEDQGKVKTKMAGLRHGMDTMKLPTSISLDDTANADDANTNLSWSNIIRTSENIANIVNETAPW